MQAAVAVGVADAVVLDGGDELIENLGASYQTFTSSGQRT
jgi:hypothetical protein